MHVCVFVINGADVHLNFVRSWVWVLGTLCFKIRLKITFILASQASKVSHMYRLGDSLNELLQLIKLKISTPVFHSNNCSTHKPNAAFLQSEMAAFFLVFIKYEAPCFTPLMSGNVLSFASITVVALCLVLPFQLQLSDDACFSFVSRF